MTETRIDLLQEALTLAMQVIESYQLDIRHAQETIGVDLLALGFCQGAVYDNALRQLMGIRLAAVLVDDEEILEDGATTIGTTAMHAWEVGPDGHGGFFLRQDEAKR